LQLEDKPLAVGALGALLRYLSEMQKDGAQRLITLNLYGVSQYMNLDVTARRNLELTETMRTREKRATLLWVLDRTKTAMGRRLIKSYIEQPLLNPTTILKRLAAVEELYSDTMLLGDTQQQLEGIYDLERIMTRIVYGSASARELKALAQTAQRIPALKGRLAAAKSRMLKETFTQLDALEDVSDLIERAICDDPPITIKDGGVIKSGYNQSVDEYREIIRNTKEYIAETERKEKEKTGIKTLKIGYNKVFGYYLEVSRSYTGQVPPEYIRKQTLTNGERYITEELKQLEARVLGASERITALETQLFAEIKNAVAAELHRIQQTARALARLDVLCSFAYVSRERGYTRPEVNVSGEILLEESRHPVIEAILTEQSAGCAPFVSNNAHLDMDQNRIAIITGPNMAGKSTFMRQIALIVLMAQIGCFVPAKSAKIGIVDSIFTRVGASDDLATGQSTFMVEMNEVAHILKDATSKSLIILDEIGRGTSTYDGMSIARAVVEYIADKRRLGAKTLFATHYHELTELEQRVDGVLNYNIAVKK
ncbi:MAG: DNA mismatch repair protein MutS, partial [Acetanaerobacterium sp.]